MNITPTPQPPKKLIEHSDLAILTLLPTTLLGVLSFASD